MARTTVRRSGLIAGLLAAVLGGALLVAPPTASAPGPGNLAPLPKGWGWLLAAGNVSGVDPSAGTASLAISGQGRGATFEGGTQWRPHPITGSQVIHILPSTIIADAEKRSATIAAIHIGMPATVWAAVKPDASVWGLKLQLGAGTKPPGQSTIAGAPGGVTGAVAHATASMLELLTAPGTLRKVIVTGATAIRNPSGIMVRGPGIAPYDIVRVEGAVNADGSVAATRVDVEMAAATAPQVSGSVDQVFPEIGGFVVSGVAVAAAPGCYWFKGSAPGGPEHLVSGQMAVAYGAPIVSGNTLVGLRARVVAMR